MSNAVGDMSKWRAAFVQSGAGDNNGDGAVVASSPRRGRKTLPSITIPATAAGAAEAEVLQSAAAAPVMAELRASAVTLHKGELAQSLKVSQAVGSIKAFQFSETVNRVALLRQLSGIRETRAYKGATLLDSGGQPVMVQTWEEFCETLGYSKRKIDEDLQNLAMFGGSLLEAQEALGLGYRDLRLLRAGLKALPPEEQQKVLDDLQSVEGSEEAQEKLDELRIRLAEAEVALKTAEADKTTKDKVIKDKGERLDKLQEQVIKLTSVAPDDQEAQRSAVNAEARKELDMACHQAMGSMNKVVGLASSIFQREEMEDATRAYVHNRVSLLCQLMGETILNMGIDVDFRREFDPDYGPESAEAADTDMPKALDVAALREARTRAEEIPHGEA